MDGDQSAIDESDVFECLKSGFELLVVNGDCFVWFESADPQFLEFLKDQNQRFLTQNAPQTEVLVQVLKNSHQMKPVWLLFAVVNGMDDSGHIVNDVYEPKKFDFGRFWP